MKESIYTIPLMDAFRSEDECPFCFLERQIEKHSIDFVLGSGASYMEDDIRSQTDAAGFCRHHYKKLYDYGNRLGAALILSTHFHKLNADLDTEIRKFTPGKSGLMKRLKKSRSEDTPATSIGQWVQNKTSRCYICDHIRSDYERYLDTFFELYKKDPSFKELFEHSKGFCLTHFGDLTDLADSKLGNKEKDAFYPALFQLMQENLKRLEEEVLWFTEKYDYRNRDKDWGTSRDSIQRCMQKDRGGHPADPPYESDR